MRNERGRTKAGRAGSVLVFFLIPDRIHPGRVPIQKSQGSRIFVIDAVPPLPLVGVDRR
jgi:hypothetical protein